MPAAKVQRVDTGLDAQLASLLAADGGIWPALLLPVVWGLLAPAAKGPTESGWSWPKDLGLAAVLGVFMAGLCGWWLARFSMVEGPFLVSDFHDYCLTPRTLAAGDMESLTRSRPLWPSWVPALLVERLGTVDSLAWGGIVGTGSIASGLYLWGRSLHGRLAGVAAALAMGFLPELLTFSRTLSFYPQITGGLTLATGMAAVALRFPGWGTLVLGGIGVGLAFNIDLRGLVWGLTCGGLVLLACFRGGLKWAPLKVALLAGLIGGAWLVAPTAYQPQMDPLEAHTSLRKRLEDNKIAVPHDFPEPTTAYLWGTSDPRQIPETLRQLREQSAAVPAEMRNARGGQHNRVTRVAPWAPVGLGVALLCLLGTLRGRDRIVRAVLLVGLSLPWLASLQGAVEIQRSFPRFLGAAWPVLAVGIGLSLAMLASLPTIWASKAPELPGWTRHVKPVGGGLIVLLLVLGVVPTWLGPTASWKVPLTAANNQVLRAEDWMSGKRHAVGREKTCLDSLLADEAAGMPWRGSLFGGVPER